MSALTLANRAMATAACVCLLPAAAAAQRLLSIDDIYDPLTRVSFSGNPVTGLRWIGPERYLWPRDRDGGVEWAVAEVSGVEGGLLFDAGRMQAALARLPGVSAAEARRQARSRSLIFNADASAMLMTIEDDLYIYVIADDQAKRLTETPGTEEVPSFSPDAARVAFVRGNDLHVVDTRTGRETRLTGDGAPKILNGRLDWVYEEEIYGRGRPQGYWWSPDSQRVAFLRTDDTPVPTFVVVDDIPYEQVVEPFDYPKAGDPNPIVTLGVASVAGGEVTWVDLSAHPADDRLLVGVAWPPAGDALVYEVQDRRQAWLEMMIADLAGPSRPRRLFRETSDAWVNPPEDAQPVWLADGSFLWLSERSGWRHVYHHAADGSLVRQVTTGAWDVRTLHGVDERQGWIYFSATERSYIGRDVYRVRTDGTGLTRLSRAPGWHSASFSPGLGAYLDTWSDAMTPPQVRLHGSDGAEIRAISANPVPVLGDYRLSAPEFVQVPTRDGFLMEGMLIKPPGFDPSRRYPVYQFTYGGPQAPQVRNAWGASQLMFHQLLAQKGIVVWVCDNRSASGKGIESARPIHHNLGELELRDIEDGLAWLKTQPWVDAQRIGIHGWSYGGFLTAYALTHSRSFTMGIAGGTVADWRNYDTVYTERYMGLPAENPKGYRRSSPRFAAADLHGALLLLHGAIDDNVHAANALQFAYELQKAGRPFEMMIYPRSRHGVSDPALVKHMRTLMVDFIDRHLLGSPRGASH
jgi:dipeptidyl-peptidase-4